AGAALALSGCGNDGASSAVIIPVNFNHGVASGDPLQDRMILWTRVTPIDLSYVGVVDVSWQISTDVDFSNILKSGVITTNPDSDFTVKEDVTGLMPGSKYFYRFNVGDIKSVIGETQTLKKDGLDPVRLAVASCSNHPFGFFNGYRAIAESGPFDAVLHLGDYIYEYGNGEGQYGADVGKRIGRLSDPEHEIITLDDYRRRHALYRSDEDLQEVHRKYPFICAWDDHEFANNSYATGALNHNEGEGDWEPRRRAGAKAFMEWLPVRISDELPTVRSFDFGKLATLAMLDTRIVGRERPLDYDVDVEEVEVEGPNGPEMKPDYDSFHKRLETEERSLLGSQQEEWLDKTLEKSNADGIPWQILGQQIIMSYRPEPPLSTVFTPEEIKNFSDGEQQSMYVAENHGGFFNPDAWDGYQPARRRVFNMLEKHGGNPIVLTGDTHCAWAMSLTDKMGGKHYGAEFAVQGITSPGRGDRIGRVEQVEQCYYDHMDHMAFANILGRGFMTLDINEDDTTAHWHFVSTVESKEFDLSLRKSLKYKLGDCADGKVTLEDVTAT
ncbi:MAG: alkaline phosphatase, partial [Kordiimonadaceae bacterium]|nr:alkaline phosphatase [Kordiimonadaceae bacterium]